LESVVLTALAARRRAALTPRAKDHFMGKGNNSQKNDKKNKKVKKDAKKPAGKPAAKN
jgi:hypothetical protein